MKNVLVSLLDLFEFMTGMNLLPCNWEDIEKNVDFAESGDKGQQRPHARMCQPSVTLPLVDTYEEMESLWLEALPMVDVGFLMY